MNERGIQLLGLALLLAGVTAIVFWVVRRGADLASTTQKAFLLLSAFAISGGFVGSTAWWIDHPSGFSWDLPPLASRMLAAAAVAFGITGFIVLRSPSRGHVRLYALMIATYLAPLAFAIVLFHRDRFDFSAAMTRAFFATVVPMTAASLWLSAKPAGLAPTAPDEASPPARSVSTFLTLAMIVFPIWALALFGTDQGPLKLVWVWPGDLLTSRLIAAMPATLAVTAFVARNSSRFARTALVLIATYGVGAIAAGVMNAAAGKAIPVLYVLGFGGFGLVAAILLWRAPHPDGASGRP